MIASIINLAYIMPVLKLTVGGSMSWAFSIGLVAVLFAAAAIGIFAFGWMSLWLRLVLLALMCAAAFVERKRIIAYVR